MSGGDADGGGIFSKLRTLIVINEKRSRMNIQNSRTMKIDIRSLGYGTPASARSGDRIAALGFDGIDYQYMFESAYDAMVITDRAGTIVHYNARALNFFGYEGLGSFDGLSIHMLIAGVTDSLLQNICAVIEDRRYMRIQAFATTLTEGFIPVELAVMGTRKASADTICYMVRDIQARRQAEQTLISAFHAMDNTDSGIGMVDLAGMITYANRKLLSMLGGGDEAKVVGQPLQTWFDDETVIQPMFAAIMAGNDWSTEKKLDEADGLHMLKLSVVPDVNDDDELMGMVLSITDVTDRRRAEIAEDQLQRDQLAFSSISEACHAIGQPATVLLTSLELLKETPGLDFESRKEVEEMCYSSILELRECLQEMNAARKKIKDEQK